MNSAYHSERQLTCPQWVMRVLGFGLLWVGFAMAQTPFVAANPTQSSISAGERLNWFLSSTVSPESLFAGGITAGWGTLIGKPKEHDSHWDGFGKRYGMRSSGIAASNLMEAGIGSLWGEDPRYIPLAGGSFGLRLGHAVKMTFLAQNRDQGVGPAYARLIAIPGSNFLSNTWRPDSDSTLSAASVRTGLGFAGRMGSNLWQEFWPDVRKRIFHSTAK